MRAMILAAGRGERMRPLTDLRPKPLLEAGGYPLIEYHLAALAKQRITEIVVNLSWLGAHIREAIGDGSRYGVAIRYSDEDGVIQGTGGGIHRALPLLGEEPFVVVNGDVWTDFSFGSLRNPPGSLAHLVLVPNPVHHPGGDYGLEGGARATDTTPRLTYAGISVLDPKLFDGCEPGIFPLKPLLDRALAAGKLSAQRHDGAWCDVGTPDRLAALDANLRLGRSRHPVLSSPVG